MGIMENEFTIRKMGRKDLDVAVEWAAREGWNPGLYDADCFYKCDPNGFLIGLLGNKPIACISVVKYNQTFGFLGFYIVHPEYRGQGYGLKIWNAGLEYLGNVNIGLDGVVAQQENYKKSGFDLAYRNIRYRGFRQKENGRFHNIKLLSKLDFEKIADYDNHFFPAERGLFLKSWIQQPLSTALGYVTHNKLRGYGVIRRCREGCKIGPLFADTPEIANEIFLDLVGSLKQCESYFLDIPEINPYAQNLVKQYNMVKVFETARMYTRETPDISIENVYGVTTFELG